MTNLDSLPEDKQTADHSRAFGGALAARGFPNKVDEQKVGHMFSDIHMLHALSYLRAQTAAKRARAAE